MTGIQAIASIPKPSFFRQVSDHDADAPDAQFDVWSVTPSGDDCADYAVGQEAADELVRYARACGHHGAIALVLAIIVTRAAEQCRQYGAMERGLFDRLGVMAYRGALN